MCFLSIRRCIVSAVCILSPLLCIAQEAAVDKAASYLSFRVPDALGTYPMSVNDSMAVTGYYLVSPTASRGFLRCPDGTIATFSVRDGIWTEPESINAAGDITGYYEVVPGVPHGFTRYANGEVVTFNPPDVGPSGPQAVPVSINAFGETAGNYPYPLGTSYGFRRTAGGMFTTFGLALGADYPTVVTGLNASGTIVGYFSSGDYTTYASSFALHPDGFLLEFSVPVEAYSLATIAESINADGAIAGWYSACGYQCKTVTTGGFVRSPDGLITLFNPPGKIVTLPGSGPLGWGQSLLSAPSRLSINQEGTITGSSTDAGGAQHGFVRNEDGVFTAFDPPKGKQTTATSINDAGVIAGSYYYDWNAQVAVGFLRIPKP
jgi:hypothetical protein